MAETDPVRVRFEGGPAQGLGPYAWDAPIPDHVFLVSAGGAWLTVWPGRDMPPGRRHRYDRQTSADDEWNATYVHTGRVPDVSAPPTRLPREATP
jgi:hypothetical protein